MSRRTPARTRLVIGATAAALLASPAFAVASAEAADTKRPGIVDTTDKLATFSGGFAYGTRVTGNALGVGSGTTGLTTMCTSSKKDVTRTNNAAVTDESPEALAKVGAITTSTSSSTKAGRTSTSTVSVTDGELFGGMVTFDALSSRTIVRGNGTDPEHFTSVVGLVVNGEPVLVGDEIPTDMPIEIPGLLTVQLNIPFVKKDLRGVAAGTTALKVKLADGTTVRAGRSNASVKLSQGSVFGGSAWGTEIDGSSIIDSGRTGLSPMPCEGGENRNDTATVEIPGLGTIGATVNETVGNVLPTGGAISKATSRVADTTLLGGLLEIRSVTTTAVAEKRPGGVTLTPSTVTGEIFVGGQALPLPLDAETLDMLDIPGLLSVDTNVVEKIKNGILVHGVVITVLDASGQPVVIKLGNAKAKIR